MLPDSHLVAGLDGLARSYTRDDGFGNGHRGAVVLAGYYMIKDGLAEAEAEAPIGALVEHFSRIPACAPFAPEAAAPHELDRLLAALPLAFGTTEAHGVIFPAFALRVFRERPDLITRSRIDGLVRMAEAYAPKQPSAAPASDPSFAAGPWSDLALDAFVGSAHAYRGRFQGHTGHILTFAQAILDLHDLGYHELARRAEAGCRVHFANCQLGPSGPNSQLTFAVTEPTPQPVRPDQAPFWQSYRPGPEIAKGLGHIIKYAYAFNSLCRRATDPGIVARARELYYLVAWG